jgi:hypothetical protein
MSSTALGDRLKLGKVLELLSSHLDFADFLGQSSRFAFAEYQAHVQTLRTSTNQPRDTQSRVLNSSAPRSAKDWRELEEMAAAVAPYEGPITRCPTGVARGQQSGRPVVTQPKQAVEPRAGE